MQLPNVRRLFIPDPGYMIAEADLAGADAQVVAWDSGDEQLKTMFKNKAQIHLENMKIVFPDAPQVKSSNPDSPYHRTKQGVHLTNYGGGAARLADTIKITLFEAKTFQQKWFSAHPAIPEWHLRIQRQLQENKTVKNMFGFRRIYFERIDGLLPEALAWVPQSTVAIVTNKGIINIHRKLPQIRLQPLLQVHDSLVFQYPASEHPHILEEVRSCMTIPIPYLDPLIIPVAIKSSPKSWGDCE